jgi:hypothetical protein
LGGDEGEVDFLGLGSPQGNKPKTPRAAEEDDGEDEGDRPQQQHKKKPLSPGGPARDDAEAEAKRPVGGQWAGKRSPT